MLSPLLHPGRGGIVMICAKAFAISLALAAVTAGAVRLASLLMGVASGRFIPLGTAFVAVWFIPLFLFAGHSSLLVFAICVAISIQLTCLGVLLVNLDSPTEPASAEPRSDAPAFALTGRRPVAATALLASGFAQAGLVSMIGGRVNLAVFLWLLAGGALARRGWIWLRESPSPGPLPVPPEVFRGLALIPTLLVIFALLPRGVRGGREEIGRGTGNSPRSHAGARTSFGRRSAATPDPVFPGIILYPVMKSTVQLIAPTSLAAQGQSESPGKPFSIPFDGVYWFWRPPGDAPPKTAVVKEGSPARFVFRSTDGTALWMEVHQNLVGDIDLSCCAAVEVLLENADSRPDLIGVELILRDTKLGAKPFQSLGVQTLKSARTQTLVFKIPHETRMRAFDEFSVRVHMHPSRGEQSANIAIQSFVLVPKERL